MLPFHGYGKTPMGPTTSAEPFALDRKVGCRLPGETGSVQVKKPLMEKYRRKRINDSLDSLRDFVLLHDQPRQGAKRQLEKADILERTVECLKKIAPAKSYPKGRLPSICSKLSTYRWPTSLRGGEEGVLQRRIQLRLPSRLRIFCNCHASRVQYLCPAAVPTGIDQSLEV